MGLIFPVTATTLTLYAWQDMTTGIFHIAADDGTIAIGASPPAYQCSGVSSGAVAPQGGLCFTLSLDPVAYMLLQLLSKAKLV